MSASGNGTVLCSFPSTSRQLAPGVFATAAAAVVVTDDTVVVGSVTLTSVNGLNGNNVTITTVGGRNNEFNEIADDVLFPIYFQQLVGREPLQDTDMDGVPDVNVSAGTRSPSCRGSRTRTSMDQHWHRSIRSTC